LNSHPIDKSIYNQVEHMNNFRVWLFRVLVIIGAALMLVSWFMPWWSIDVHEIGKNSAIIHPWGLETHLRDSEYALIADAEMPQWFPIFVFAYLGVAMLALLVGLFGPNKGFALGKIKLSLPNVLIGLVGLSYLITLGTAVVFASYRMSGYFGGVNFIGYTYIDLGEPYHSGADAGLEVGYFVGVAAGLLLLVFGLLRNKIIAAPKVAK
jgi:hypothetical protein